MKKKKINKKLFLNKEIISNLNEVKGGGGKCAETVPSDSCATQHNCQIEKPTLGHSCDGTCTE